MNWRIEQPTLTYRLINARRRSGTLHALYPNEIESSSGTAVKHTNARKQTCTHVSWLVHRVENVYARLYHGRGYWLLCPTASDIAYRATISQIITPLANLVWKNRTMDFQSKSPPLHDEFDFDEYSLFDFSVSSRGHVVHRWPKKSGEKGGRLAWLRVAEFKRLLKPFPCIRDHRGAFQYSARAPNAHRCCLTIVVCIHVRETWSHCFSIRVYRWSGVARNRLQFRPLRNEETFRLLLPLDGGTF